MIMSRMIRMIMIIFVLTIVIVNAEQFVTLEVFVWILQALINLQELDELAQEDYLEGDRNTDYRRAWCQQILC